MSHQPGSGHFFLCTAATVMSGVLTFIIGSIMGVSSWLVWLLIFGVILIILLAILGRRMIGSTLVSILVSIATVIVLLGILFLVAVLLNATIGFDSFLDLLREARVFYAFTLAIISYITLTSTLRLGSVWRTLSRAFFIVVISLGLTLLINTFVTWEIWMSFIVYHIVATIMIFWIVRHTHSEFPTKTHENAHTHGHSYHRDIDRHITFILGLHGVNLREPEK